MKEQYIKEVKRQLHLSGKTKQEVLRDLEEVFASAMEHGESEEQVMARLGSPKEFADNTAVQFGVDNTARGKRKGFLSVAAALFIAAAAFALYGAAQLGRAPEDAIGQANAMTNIQVVGTLGLDATQISWAVGWIAAAAAVLLLIRTIRNNRR